MFPVGNAGRFSEMESRIADYEERLKQGITMGIPFGVKLIDDLTMGIQRHEYVTVAGWQGQGKSTLAQHIAFSGYLAGFTSVIVSLEMEAEAILRRFDVMATNLQYRALKKCELNSKDKEIWIEWAKKAANVSNDIVVLDDVYKCTTEKIQAIGEQYNPDLLIVDYVSLLHSPQNKPIWEKVTDFTGELKALARNPAGPPIIGIAQTNIQGADDGAKLENLAYSRSIGQDSDLVLGLYQDSDGKMKARNEMEIRLIKNRDGETGKTKFYWNPSRMEFREWQTSDMFTTDEDNE